MLRGEQILELQKLVRKVPVTDHVIHYTLALVRQTRIGEPGVPKFIRDWLSWGAGPRAVQNLILGGKARALLYGRAHVQTEDIQALAYPVLRHRILTNFTAASEGITTDTVIKKLLEETPSQGRRTDPRRTVQEDLRVVNVVTSSSARLDAAFRERLIASRRYESRLSDAPIEDSHSVAVKRRRSAPFSASRRPSPGSLDWIFGPGKWSRGSSPACTAARSSGIRSSSCSTASTRPATTSATSTGRSGRKTDRFYIKQYEAETNLRSQLVDRRQRVDALRPGPAQQVRLRLHRSAPAWRYLLLRQQDAVGCITFDSDVRQIVPARSQNTHIDAIVKAMDVSRPREKTDILRRSCAASPRTVRAAA